MGNIQWGPCGGQKRRKGSAQRNGLAAAAQRKSDGEVLETAASTGYGSYGSYGGGYGLGSVSYGLDCPEGIDEDLALLATAAAIAASLFVLYRQIVLQTGKRRKRSLTSKNNGQLEEHIISFNPINNSQGKIHNVKSDIHDTSHEQQPTGIGFIEGSSLWTFIVSGTNKNDNSQNNTRIRN